jgi:hypothetical protein
VEFDDGTTQAEFASMIDESQQREKIRQERKKNAEGLATMKIDSPLKSSFSRDGWKDSVRTALMPAHGSKGVPLLRIVQENPASIFPVVPAGGVAPSWEELATDAAPLSGLDYDADQKTVHLFLLNNVSEDSDAHACIHPLVARNDGRLDWQALCERCENEAAVQARVNQANKTWEMLAHKNERAMSFEAFSKKLTKALQHFDDTGRPKHDGDVIDWIWRHVQSGELSQHMSAPKVGQSIHLRTSEQILQEIAKEVPNLSKASNFEPRISEIQQGSSGSGGFAFDRSRPSSGAHASDGKLHCGTCSPSCWFSNNVLKPFHEQIREHRDQHGNRSSNSRNANWKLQQLKTQEEFMGTQIWRTR